MKKYLPMIVCGFGAGVLNIVPVIKTLSCCLIIPAAAVFALILEQRANNNYSKITAKQASVFGILTGISAAIFSTLIIVLVVFITKSSEINESIVEFQKFLDTLPDPGIGRQFIDIMTRMSDEISQTGFSGMFTFLLFTGYFITDIIFGLIGGLVGMRILNNRIDPNA